MNNRWPEIFGSDWPYIRTLGAAIKDPEEKKTFWDGVREAKEKDPKWSIYDWFPISESAKDRARNECVEYVRSLRRPREVADEKKDLQELPVNIPK